MRPPFKPWLCVVFVGGISYPLLVYFGQATVPHALLVAVALVLVAARLRMLRTVLSLRLVLGLFAAIACGSAALLMLDGPLAVKAYPILVSLGVAALFGALLNYPPSAVERMARLREPDLPPAGVIYTRRVTVVWVCFLLGNAAVSAASAVWGTLEEWTLWNGLISYLLMGVLFIGEYGVRRVVRR